MRLAARTMIAGGATVVIIVMIGPRTTLESSVKLAA